MVRRDETGGGIGDRGVVSVRGAHDRSGLDGPVDREDAGRAIDRREGDIKPCGLGRRGRGRQIEKDLGRRTGIGRAVEHRGLDIVPVTGIVAGPHHVTDSGGVLSRVVHEGAPVRRDVERRPARVTRQGAAIGRHVMFPVVELVRIPVRNSELPHRRPQSQGRPGDRAQVQGLARSYGDVRLFKGADHAGTESPEVIGTWRHVGYGKTATRSRVDPELVGQVLLLEIHPAVDRCHADPQAHRRGPRIIGVVDGEGAAHRGAAGRLGIDDRGGRPGHRLGIEPGIRPGRLLRLGLGLGVRPKDPGLQGNGVAGRTRVLVGVNERWAEGLGRKGTGGLVLA